jgi:hypothetical protein
MVMKMNAKERRWNALVRDLSCIVRVGHYKICGSPAAIHHTGTGAGGRKDNMKVIPICHYHHQGDQGIHTIGRKAWEKLYGTEEELLNKVNKLLGIENEKFD